MCGGGVVCRSSGLRHCVSSTAVCPASGRTGVSFGTPSPNEYGKDETSAYLEYAPRTFRNFGYTNGGTITPYSFPTLKAEIESNHPLIMAGNIQKNTSGHAWVVSSIMVEQIPYDIIDPQSGMSLGHGVDVFYLIHCNWGWENGYRNGFYIQDYFNPAKGPKLDDYGNPVNPDHDPNIGKYECNLRMLHGIRK